MNNITVAGQLGKDAELRNMPNGDAVLSFSVADSQGRDKPTIWWNAQLFGKRAEALQKYLVKGQAVTITGPVTEREWVDRDGGKRKSMEVRCNDVALQGGKREASPEPRSTRPIHDAVIARSPAPAPSGFEDMSDDIPFRDPLSYRGAHLVL